MKRHVELKNPLLTTCYSDGSSSVGVTIDAVSVQRLCCELMLLLYEKSLQLTLRCGTKSRLVLTVGGANGSIKKSADDLFCVEFSSSQTECLLAFLLNWYRDTIAEVPHLDIELLGDKLLGRDCTLVVKAEESRAPLSPEEVQRLLKNS